MRFNSISIFKIVAATTFFTLIAGCLEQSTTAKKDKNNAENKAFIQRDNSGQLVLAAPKANTLLPKISKIVSPLAALPPHTIADHLNYQPNHVRGARIYDDFLIELDKTADITVRNPLLDAANEKALAAKISAPKSYRCGYCHGYDYEGTVFTWNGGTTNNLLELRDVRGKTEEDIINFLFTGFKIVDSTGKVTTVHDYSALLTAQAMVDVADFVVNEIYDTHVYIRAPSSESLGDMTSGTALYTSAATSPPGISPVIKMDGSNYNCLDCHGSDGKGLNATTPFVKVIDLPALAWQESFKFLHRSLFGTPRSLAKVKDGSLTLPNYMPGFYETVLTDGLHFGGPEQGAATLKYIQSMTPVTP